VILQPGIQVFRDEDDPDLAPLAQDGDPALVAVQAQEGLTGKPLGSLNGSEASFLLEFQRQGIPSRLALPCPGQGVQVP